MRDLLDLLVFLGFSHKSVVFLGEKCPLTLNDLTDLVLFLATEADFTLVEKSAQELTPFDLLLQLALANVKEFIALLPDDCMVLSHLTWFLLDLLFSIVVPLAGFFLNHAIHGDVHRFWSVGDASCRLRYQVNRPLDRLADETKHSFTKTDCATLDSSFLGPFDWFHDDASDGRENLGQHRFRTVCNPTHSVRRNDSSAL